LMPINSQPTGEPKMSNSNDEVTLAAGDVQQAEQALQAARKKHAEAKQRAAGRHISEMTPAERRAAARARGITGPV
jgi:hypothetical protein